MTLTKLNFITGNKNKLAEVRAILGNVIEVDNQAVYISEIQGTIEEIAEEKARRAAEVVFSSPVTFIQVLCVLAHAGIAKWTCPSRRQCARIQCT